MISRAARHTWVLVHVELTLVQISQLAIGAPLPWDLFNQDREQLLARGHIINSPDELQVLRKTPLFRMEEATPTPAAMNALPTTGVVASQYQFGDMRLSVGDRLQLSPPARVGGDRCMVKLIGYVEKKLLIVYAPPSGKWRPTLIEGDQIAIRVFSGQTAFGFSAYVDNIIKQPFEYLHLSFPKNIVGKVIRKSRRVKTAIAATIADNPTPSIISNLSLSGAELRAKVNLGELGTAIRLSFSPEIYGIETPMSLHAVIRSLKQDHEGVEGAWRCGVEFQDLQPSDVAALQSLIYQELVEHPKNIA
jgi:hypothetical protein